MQFRTTHTVELKCTGILNGLPFRMFSLSGCFYLLVIYFGRETRTRNIVQTLYICRNAYVTVTLLSYNSHRLKSSHATHRSKIHLLTDNNDR